ncbi:hypothetical protein RZS08_01945, partial [Arthrospira platensis SPKY1]|nr:hypothetical protein [Arthrospira platensis SPKY1]
MVHGSVAEVVPLVHAAVESTGQQGMQAQCGPEKLDESRESVATAGDASALVRQGYTADAYRHIRAAQFFHAALKRTRTHLAIWVEEQYKLPTAVRHADVTRGTEAEVA